jgi:hypothetical protein
MTFKVDNSSQSVFHSSNETIHIFQAIKVLENIELNKKSLYSRVPGCQITMYYYVGFAYMMMRRYADAVRTFSNILLYIQRTRGLFQVRLIDYDLRLFSFAINLMLNI